MQGIEHYLNDRDAGPGARGLVLPLSGDPGPEPPERTSQGPHLAHPAALLVAVLVEGEEALGPHQSLHLAGVREHVLDAGAVVLLHLIEELVRLRVEASRVQAEHAERAPRQLRVLDQRHVLGAAARHDGLTSV
jgi:hypothetical protein